MEALLTLSFDNLSSRDTSRIRKGLRQIEGLLAQIALSSARLSPHKRRKSSAINDNNNNNHNVKQAECKKLGELRRDAAFREFFRLQEGFRWNVASRLIATLERLMGLHSASTTDLVILSTLDLLQGVLLLHPPSRTLFNREDYMNLLLDLLDASNPPKIQSQALLVLVTALLANPKNTRTFETIDGLLTVTSLFKSRSTAKEVKMRTLEFLYFYLMPEAPPTTSASAPNTVAALGLQRSPSKLQQSKQQALAGHARTHSGDSDRMDIDEDGPKATKTTDDKQRLLGRHLNNVAELVQDLQENAVFGGAAAA
ncbi:hypothetical protein LTR36_001576 [Oleoguttula mirabilis]|uniref:Cell division control protein 14 n=1 Tax=Oleoguttula mirabilis TaxID=1507867 RepID=A0AAV9JNA9_9PEZI|nr:hypothetical protein LTR36_001576 [Oleoguttula mirabilis]